jgi:hypothetical protein
MRHVLTPLSGLPELARDPHGLRGMGYDLSPFGLVVRRAGNSLPEECRREDAYVITD